MRKSDKEWKSYCGKTFETRQKMFDHKKTCPICRQWAKDKNKRAAETRKETWTEENHKRCSEAQRKAWENPDRRRKQSESAKQRNFWKTRSKNPIIYKSDSAGTIRLDSEWELIVAKRLDELHVEWFRPKIRLPYIDSNGIEHGYFPDFYIKTFNCFIEVKSPYISELQNKEHKIDFIKSTYSFVKWLESKKDCETFTLKDLGYSGDCPEKDLASEEEIDFWIKKSSKEKTSKRQESVKKLESERWEIIQNSKIDFSKFGWVEQISKQFGIAPGKGGKYIRTHFPEFYKTCFKRQSNS